MGRFGLVLFLVGLSVLRSHGFDAWALCSGVFSEVIIYACWGPDVDCFM